MSKALRNENELAMQGQSGEPCRERTAHAKAQRQKRAGVVEGVPVSPPHAESLRGGWERGRAHMGPTSRCPLSQGSALHGLFPLPQTVASLIFSSFMVVYRDRAWVGTS